MSAAFEIRNDMSDVLEVWIEPWCHPYYVPRGSTLGLSYKAEGTLLTEHTAERLVVWLNSKYEPDAVLGGRRVLPDFR
jgi:hypothetical protein